MMNCLSENFGVRTERKDKTAISKPSVQYPGLFVPSVRVGRGLPNVRAWFWLVVAIKAKWSAINA